VRVRGGGREAEGERRRERDGGRETEGERRRERDGGRERHQNFQFETKNLSPDIWKVVGI
jgi:hypothetical protein